MSKEIGKMTELLRDTLNRGLGGKTSKSSQTPTITTGVGFYAAGDAVGGLLTFSNVLFGQNKSGVITTMVLTDKAAQDIETELWLFDTSFTATTDGGAFTLTDPDLSNCIGVISTADGAYYDGANNSIGVVRNVGLGITGNGTTLYGQLVTRGTPSYASTSDLTVSIITLQD